jgi:hypothetical protein
MGERLMVAVGMLLTWLGYGLGLEGWCLWRDYDVTLGQLMSPLHPYAGPWPPPPVPSGQTWPGGTTAAAPAGQGSAGQTPGPAAAVSAGSRATQIIKNISQYVPGFGFIK